MLRTGRGMLKKVAGILPSLVISVVVGMSGAGPAQASHNYAQWGHDAVKVVAVHHIAQSAGPGVQVTTAHRGPALP